MKNNLIIHKLENVQECEEVFVEHLLFDEWHECEQNEFVRDGIVYKKVYSQKTKSIPYYFNPAVGNYTKGSMHLDQAIKDEKVCWLANMVTYYRHTLPSWDRCWGRNGNRYRARWFRNYDDEKAKVNERQKRKIVRKHLDFIKENGITVDHFKMLQGTDSKTIEFAEHKLNGKKLKRSRFVSIEEAF